MADWTSISLALGLEVLRLAAVGTSTNRTATTLGISEAGVRMRRIRMCDLLGARDLTHAVVIAAAEGLLTAEELQAAARDRRPDWRPES